MVTLKQFNILFLEDNLEFAQNTTELFNIYFNRIHHCDSIKEAKRLFNIKNIDIIISDIKIKDTNGLEFVRYVRDTNNNIPIIILTAFKDEDFLLKAIPLNISSYQLKPLSYENFINVTTLLSKKLKSEQTLEITKDIEFNIYTKELFKNKKYIDLTKKEALFVDLLFTNKQKIVSYEMMQNSIWGEKEMSQSAIKNFILRLRKKIDKEFITTVSGRGYKLSL